MSKHKSHSRIVFRGADAVKAVEITSPEELRDVVLKTGNDYWKQGSGDAPVTFEAPHRVSHIALMCRVPYGMIITHTYDKDDVHDREMHVAIASSTSDEDVSLWVGGDFTLFPKAFFLPRKLAWEIVSDFFTDGERSSKVKWMPYLRASVKFRVKSGNDPDSIYGDPY